MILDSKVKIETKSPKTTQKLKEIGIESKKGDIVILPIEKLWKGSHIKVKVKCDICGTEKMLAYRKYIKNFEKYKIYSCSQKCSKIKSEKTCMEKYGVAYVGQSKEVIEKRKKTCLEKYGVVYVGQSKEVIEKRKKTCLEKYGTTTTLLNKETDVKIKKTNLERYGSEYPISTKEIREKAKNTKKEKYGDVEYNNREKYVETCLNKYGVESTNKLEFVKNKKINTQLKKYGLKNNSMSEICKNKLIKTNLERYGVEYVMQVEEFFIKQQKSAFKIKQYRNTELFFQGTYELDFLEHCEKLKLIDIIQKPKPINFIFENKNKKYYPDFFIQELNLIIEIKSTYIYNKFLDKNIQKEKSCIEQGYNYLLIKDKNYKSFDKYIKKIIF